MDFPYLRAALAIETHQPENLREKIYMKKLACLDSIRGWGAFVVVIYHVFVNGFPVSPESVNLLKPLFLFNGTLAVWIFFIVSGFSLSIGYAMSGEKRILLRIAYGRYLRLAIPILFFSLLMYALFHVGLVPSVDDRPSKYRDFLAESPTLMGSIYFSLFNVFFNYQSSQTLIPPLWTMPIEMIGSFLVIILCALFGQAKWKLVFYSIALLLTLFFSPYYSAFLLGVIMAEFFSQKKLKQSQWIPLAVFCFGIILATRLPEAGPHLYLLVSFMLFYSMLCCTPIQRFLEFRISAFMGKISFTLYLIHSIVMWTFTLPLTDWFNRAGGASPAILTTINIVTIVVAILLSRLFVNIDEFAVLASRKFSQTLVAITLK